MNRFVTLFTAIAALSFLSACSESNSRKGPGYRARLAEPRPTPPPAPKGLPSINEFAQASGAFGSSLSVPDLSKSAEDLNANREAVLNVANERITELLTVPLNQRTFENSVVALESILADVAEARDQAQFLMHSSPNEEIRSAAAKSFVAYTNWVNDFYRRADLFEIVDFIATKIEKAGKIGVFRPDLTSEESQLVKVMSDQFRLTGASLKPDAQIKVKEIQDRLSVISTEFSENINNDKTTVSFTLAELDGLSKEQLNSLTLNGEQYIAEAKNPNHAVLISTFARNAETRKKFMIARWSVAVANNSPLLDEALILRQKLAQEIGFASWVDLRTSNRLAKDAATVESFLNDLMVGTEAKFADEMAKLQFLKALETGEPAATIDIFDISRYSYLLKNKVSNVDQLELMKFFEFNHVVAGMLKVYEQTFSIRLTEVAPPYKWTEDLKLYVISDAKTNEPLGAIYFDMHPREGKFNHYAIFGLKPARTLKDGTMQRPVCSFVCNFPKAKEGQPALLTLSDVETLFHEFGHALHQTLTRARYAILSGTEVEQDFVEAPSQLLERWVTERPVLDLIAKHIDDPTKTISDETLAGLKNSNRIANALFYRRQLALALSDFRMHFAPGTQTSAEIIDATHREVFFELPPDTNFAASWGHMMGYDAAYYGYAWADAISEDLFSPFQASQLRILDPRWTSRLRREIYEVGGSRPASVSIDRFLGRPYSLKPFMSQFEVR